METEVRPEAYGCQWLQWVVGPKGRFSWLGIPQVSCFVPFEVRVGFHEGLLVLSGQFGVLLLLFRVEGCPPLAQNLGNTSILEVRVLLSDYASVALTEYKKCIHRSLLWLIWTNVCGGEHIGQWWSAFVTNDQSITVLYRAVGTRFGGALVVRRRVRFGVTAVGQCGERRVRFGTTFTMGWTQCFLNDATKTNVCHIISAVNRFRVYWHLIGLCSHCNQNQ